jgi:putative CocE/NonD family hydrolase
MKSETSGPCQPEQEEKPAKPKDIDLVWGLKIPMRDGIKLNATVYKPQKMESPRPVIFTLTPYISDSYHPRAYYFSQSGYVFVLADSRGRGNSEGNFQPNFQEALDGHDIVEWMARQSWCNGKVAMWGGSYGGHNQWATLKEFPTHLKTIVPVASGFPGVDFPSRRNIFYCYVVQWLTFTSGVTRNQSLFEDSSFWIQKFRELYEAHLPFKELDKMVGNPSPTFKTWLSHPCRDSYWDAMNPTDEEFSKMNLPILTITGHYDGDQPGAMEFYKRHMEHASSEACSKHYLIIGPWDHLGTRTPQEEIGGLKFGKASLLNMNKLHTEWYDWTMKNGEKPEFLKKRVAYYVTGAEKWKYADDLKSLPTSLRRLYLKSDGKANDIFQSGELAEEKPEDSPSDHYVYDPLDTRPAEFEKEEVKNWITDQRYALNLFGNGLVYHSQPFPDDTEITGYLKLVAWIEMDVPDTDFWVLVYEIKSDGTSILLTQDMMRARYRESLREEKLVEPGKINCYEFDGFFFFSRQIAKGSRLRLVIRAPNSIHWQKNYNSGGEVAAESGKDARTAYVTLYHDAEHPSYLELPIADKQIP